MACDFGSISSGIQCPLTQRRNTLISLPRPNDLIISLIILRAFRNCLSCLFLVALFPAQSSCAEMVTTEDPCLVRYMRSSLRTNSIVKASLSTRRLTSPATAILSTACIPNLAFCHFLLGPWPLPSPQSSAQPNVNTFTPPYFV